MSLQNLFGSRIDALKQALALNRHSDNTGWEIYIHDDAATDEWDITIKGTKIGVITYADMGEYDEQLEGNAYPVVELSIAYGEMKHDKRMYRSFFREAVKQKFSIFLQEDYEFDLNGKSELFEHLVEIEGGVPIGIWFMPFPYTTKFEDAERVVEGMTSLSATMTKFKTAKNDESVVKQAIDAYSLLKAQWKAAQYRIPLQEAAYKKAAASVETLINVISSNSDSGFTISKPDEVMYDEVMYDEFDSDDTFALKSFLSTLGYETTSMSITHYLTGLFGVKTLDDEAVWGNYIVRELMKNAKKPLYDSKKRANVKAFLEYCLFLAGENSKSAQQKAVKAAAEAPVKKSSNIHIVTIPKVETPKEAVKTPTTTRKPATATPKPPITKEELNTALIAYADGNFDRETLRDLIDNVGSVSGAAFLDNFDNDLNLSITDAVAQVFPATVTPPTPTVRKR
jgi:hypothetical protein